MSHQYSHLRFSPARLSVAVHCALLSMAFSGLALAVEPNTAVDEDSPAILPATRIQEQALADEQLPGSYAGGQVATGGRVGLLGNRDFMDTPFSTISYTSKYAEDLQAQEITDVIAATDPAVFNNGLKSVHAESYSIRGFATSISDASIGGLFGVAPFYRISPEMYERIEVHKGPSALLNGMPPNGSVGGTVNLVPKRAGSESLTRLSSTYSSDAKLGGHLDLGRRFGDEQQFGVRFNQVYRDGDTATDDQRQRSQLSALALDWRAERVRLSADLYSSDDLIRGQNRGLSLASGVAVPRAPSAETLLNPSWAYVESRDKGAIVRGEYDINDQLMAYVAYGASQTDYRYSGAMTAQVINNAGDISTSMGQLKMELAKTSGEAGLKGRFQTGPVGHQWSLNMTHYGDEQKDYGRRMVPGATWVTNIRHPVWGPAAPEDYPAIAHSESRLTSYGIADTLSVLDDQLQVTLGVRRQNVRTDTYSVATGARSAPAYDEGATTPATAVLYKLTDSLSLYANYIEGLSKGAAAPSTADNYPEVFPPYKSKQKEIGLKLDLGSFSHTLSLYEIKRPNSYTVNNVFSFGGEQRNRGVEWGFFGSPLADVRLMGGVAYVDAEVTKTAVAANQGKTATGMPKLQGKLGAEWDTPLLQGLTLTANVTSVDKQYISVDNSQSIPGYTLYDLGARYATQLAARPLTLRASLDNVTNKAYWGTPLTSSLGLGEPRTLRLSATVDF